MTRRESIVQATAQQPQWAAGGAPLLHERHRSEPITPYRLVQQVVQRAVTRHRSGQRGAGPWSGRLACAFLTGGLTAIFVALWPQRLATCIDRIYLPAR